MELEVRAVKRRAREKEARQRQLDEARRQRKDAMAHSHRERQQVIRALPLRVQRQQIEQKMDAASERREAYLGRFVARTQSR